MAADARRLEVAQEVEKHPDCGVGVLDGDRLRGVVAHAALAADEQHPDRAQIGHGESVVAGTAGKPQRPDPGTAHGGLELLDEPGRAGRCRYVIGYAPLEPHFPSSGLNQ